MMETNRYMCMGCGTEYSEHDVEVSDGFHARAEHDPTPHTPGDRFCMVSCPIPVQCGPIQRMDDGD